MADDQDVTTKDSEAGEVEAGGLVPPYDGRTTGGDSDLKEELSGTIDRQLDETKKGNPGATTSPAEESAVSDSEVAQGSAGSGDQTATDTKATTPHGVGESTTRRGEDVKEDDGKEPGRQDTGTKGQSERPTGTSTQRDSTGVDPQDPDDGPNLPGGYSG